MQAVHQEDRQHIQRTVRLISAGDEQERADLLEIVYLLGKSRGQIEIAERQLQAERSK